MSEYRKIQLRDLLRLEVAKKSEATCLSFGMFSILSFFYHFGCVKFIGLIQSISVLLLILSIVRFFFTKNLKESKQISNKNWNYLVILIWLNALGWSVILNSASFELKFDGIHFIVVSTLIAGLVGASIVTLSYFPILFIPFQVLLLIPQVAIITYYYFNSTEHINYLPLIILYSMYFFYQMKQFKQYRYELIRRFSYQIDLEIANKELKESKDELIEQTTKLVHISRLAALGEMSVGIAHEINNPLTIMKGGAQLIEKMITRQNFDADSILKQSLKIQNSINRVTTIIKGLKNFSNLSDNRPKEIVTLAAVMDDTYNFCLEPLVTNDITLIIDSVPECKIHCHPVQISQVLINLIKNAQDFLTECSLENEKKWIKIHFGKEENVLLIKVSNNGKKISDDISKKIFQPFFSTKPIEGGTGLGLSISQKIMKEHNGDLALDMVPDYTTFIVTHPLYG